MRPFEKEEWPIFFGPEQISDEVIARLARQQVVMVHGDSSCGKSSLIRAGVLAQLEQENARSGVRWRTCAMLPRESPLRNLARSLAELDPDRNDRNRVREIRRTLNLGRGAPAALAGVLRRGVDDHICILIDQFEELFLFAKRHGRDEAQLFVDILVGLQADPPPGLYAILAMRSEFLGVCARFKGLAEAVNRTQYLLPQMERPALMRAICEPAPLYDGEVSLELAERLIADAGGGQDQLPLIQHGLMLLWQRKFGQPKTGPAGPGSGAGLGEAPGRYHHERGPARPLGLSDYRESGGLAKLLSNHADQVMHKAAPDAARQKVVEHLYRALTDINAEGHAIRRPQTFAELREVTGADEQTLRDILDPFRAENVSFLRPYGDAPIGPDTLIDISHEALIRCWPKIADAEDGWLRREFRDGLVWKSLLVMAGRNETLSAAATVDRSQWLKTLPSKAWADRYGGGWIQVKGLIERSQTFADQQQEARRREQEVRARLAEDAREGAAALTAKKAELFAAHEGSSRRLRHVAILAVSSAIWAVVATAVAIWRW
jgi:hypothetical protein